MSQKVFRDPIYGDITFSLPEDQVLLDLIDTATFQRLRRINQTGVAYLVYHGAEHSRFTHSLGAMHIMTLAIDHLIREAPDEHKQTLQEYRQHARIAALLHDLGHGPFSHNFEKVVPQTHARRHEHWSMQLIREREDVQRVLHSHQIDPEHICQIIQLSFAQCPIIQELLSGHLDIDRMDYLLRDSHATGVKYGIFDWERLTRSLTLYTKDTMPRLAITPKGVHAMEELILARYFMYDQVYTHKTVLAGEFLLQKMIIRAQGLLRSTDIAGTPTSIQKLLVDHSLSADEYFRLDDVALLSAITAWSTHDDAILSDLAQRFLNRTLPVSIPATADNQAALLQEAQKQAEAAGYDPAYYVDMLDTALTPYPPYNIAQNITDLVVLTAEGPQYITEHSEVIRSFHGKSFTSLRVCMPREIRDSL